MNSEATGPSAWASRAIRPELERVTDQSNADELLVGTLFLTSRDFDEGHLRYTFMAHPPPRLRWWLLAMDHKRAFVDDSHKDVVEFGATLGVMSTQSQPSPPGQLSSP